MNPNQYQLLAAKTESMPNEEMVGRLREMCNGLFNVLDHVKDMGQEVDVYKRHVFYNKQPTSYELDRVLTSVLNDSINYSPDICPLLRTNDDRFIRAIHAIFGLITEVGELTEGVIAYEDAVLKGDEEQREKCLLNIKEEIADSLWYDALMCNAFDISMEDAMESNIRKLQVRFPNKFNSEDAVNRDFEAEKKALDATPDTVVDEAFNPDDFEKAGKFAERVIENGTSPIELYNLSMQFLKMYQRTKVEKATGYQLPTGRLGTVGVDQSDKASILPPKAEGVEDDFEVQCKCPTCRNPFKVKSSALDRADRLQKTLYCGSCELTRKNQAARDFNAQ